MPRQESTKLVLTELLQWERPSKKQTDPIEVEYIVPGPVDGFVDQAANYVTALRKDGKVDEVLDRAKQFESLTATGSAIDGARGAIRPIIEEIAKAREGIGGMEWGKSRPPCVNAGGIMVRRRPPQVISQDVANVIANLGKSIDCLRWNPGESHRCVRKLLAYRLEARSFLAPTDVDVVPRSSPPKNKSLVTFSIP